MRRPLFLICILGLVLRLWGIDWGLPALYHQDEPVTIKAALSFGQGIHAVTYIKHPHLFHEMLFGIYGVGYLVGKSFGWFNSTAVYIQQFLEDPSAWVISGRILAALFGTATIPLLYWLGQVAYKDRKVSLLSALALAVVFLHVRNSHYCRQDIPALFFAVFASVLCLLVALRGKLADYISAGVIIGFAVSTKWNMLLWVAGLGFAHILGQRQLPRPWIFPVAGLLLVPLMFIVACPALALKIPETFSVLGHFAAAASGSNAGGGAPTISPGWWRYLTEYLPLGMGWIGVVLGFGGVFGAILRRTRADLWLAVLTVAYIAVIGGFGKSVHAEYILPVVPFLLLLGVRWAASLKPVIRWALLSGIIITNLAASARHDWLLTQDDTRTRATRWIEQHIPSGSVIGVDHGRTLQAWVPQFRKPSSYAMIELTEVPHVAPEAENYYDLNALISQGAEYVVLSSFVTQFHAQQHPANRQRFYEQLGARAERLALFHPFRDAQHPVVQDAATHTPLKGLWGLARPGPVVEVYALRRPR